MIQLVKNNVTEVLETLTEELDAEIYEDYGCAALILDNKHGKGRITAYALFPGLAALIYNIEFTRSITLEVDEKKINTLYFIFSINGKIEQKFATESSFRTISTQQNVILSSEQGGKNIFRLPGNQKLEISVIFVFRDTEADPIGKPSYMRSGLNEILMDLGSIDSLKYFGHIRPETANLVRSLIHNEKSGTVARLRNEALILNILSSQLEFHDDERRTPTLGLPLKESELETILAISKAIAEKIEKPHRIKDLSNRTGLSPQKLQTGFNYLYGSTVNAYIQNVRLESALELLRKRDLSISEVVYSIGFTSRSYFSKLFKERYGLTPRDYRDSLS